MAGPDTPDGGLSANCPTDVRLMHAFYAWLRDRSLTICHPHSRTKAGHMPDRPVDKFFVANSQKTKQKHTFAGSFVATAGRTRTGREKNIFVHPFTFCCKSLIPSYARAPERYSHEIQTSAVRRACFEYL